MPAPQPVTFYRLATDGTRTPATIDSTHAGPTTTPLWIIGGGPSLTAEICALIQQTAAATFAFNLNGHALIRPTFWTFYDTTNRFHRSTFLNPAITKFAHHCRAKDLIPGTTHKVCDAPNLYFFNRNPRAGFADFPAPGNTITDWNDSLCQALHIAYKLGFRRLYLAGCDMHVSPSQAQISAAAAAGATYTPLEPLKAFYDRWQATGADRAAIDALNTTQQYHFEQTKSPGATLNTDLHYWRVTQYLRLARRAIAAAGLQIISCTPHSRLNDIFPHITPQQAAAEIHQLTGNPLEERTAGRYTKTNPQARPGPAQHMRDIRPHNWPARETPPKPRADPPETAVPLT